MNLNAEKIIEQLRRQLDVANYQTALATAAAEQAAQDAAAAQNRVTELEAQLNDRNEKDAPA